MKNNNLDNGLYIKINTIDEEEDIRYKTIFPNQKKHSNKNIKNRILKKHFLEKLSLSKCLFLLTLLHFVLNDSK